MKSEATSIFEQVKLEEEMDEEAHGGSMACRVSAYRMWMASIEDGHNCLPKVVPNVISSIEYCAPPPGCSSNDIFNYPGCSRTIHFQPHHVHLREKQLNLKLSEHVTEMIEEIDSKSYKIKVKVVDGGFLGAFMEAYKFSILINEGLYSNTCIVNWKFQYRPLSTMHKSIPSLILRDVIPKSFRGLEAYLLTHDDYITYKSCKTIHDGTTNVFDVIESR